MRACVKITVRCNGFTFVEALVFEAHEGLPFDVFEEGCDGVKQVFEDVVRHVRLADGALAEAESDAGAEPTTPKHLCVASSLPLPLFVLIP